MVVQTVVGNPPSLNGGGPIPDGVYLVIAQTDYVAFAPPDAGPMLSFGTQRFSGNETEFISDSVGAQSPIFTAAETYSLAGPKLSFSRSCPIAGAGTAMYEINGDQLMLLNGTQLRTLQKQ